MQDKLDLYLMTRYADNYWSGGTNPKLMIWGTDREIPKMISLNYGMRYYQMTWEPGGDYVRDMLIYEYNNNPAIKRVIDYVEKLSQRSSIPFVVIVYPSVRVEHDLIRQTVKSVYDPNKVVFYWFETLDNCKCVLGEDLRQYCCGKSLCEEITMVEVDGLIVDNSGENGIFLEINRNRLPLPKWKPYKTEISEYALISNCSQRVGAGFWLLHYADQDCNDEDVISFYDIEGIDKTKPEDFLITKECVYQCSLTGADSLDVRIKNFIQ